MVLYRHSTYSMVFKQSISDGYTSTDIIENKMFSIPASYSGDPGLNLCLEASYHPTYLMFFLSDSSLNMG
jgi:hypothetical protein